jgi:hypothetical protein
MATVSQSGLFTLQAFTSTGAMMAGGRLYFYVAGTTTKKDVYTDAAGSVPHTLTSDGVGGEYLALDARGEAPAPLYLTSGAYDVTLKTAAGATVWTRQADPIGADLAASGGSASIGFLQAGSGAVARTVQARLRDHVSVKDFGAVGDGETNDKAAIVLAIAASKNLFFPAGTYYLGTTSGGEHLLPINGAGGRVSIKTDGVVKFLTETTASGSAGSIFRITNANGVVIDHIEGEDTGHDFTTTTGVCLLNIASTDGYPVTNINIGSLKGYHVNAALRTSGLFADRVSNINIGAVYCNECYYGVNLQYQGDNVHIGALYFNAGQRSLFGYGARDVRAKVYSTNARAGSADLLINAEYNQLVETEDWEIEYTCRTPVNSSALVQMKAHGETSKIINNIRIHFDVVSTTAANVFEVRAYDSGTTENTSTTNNVFSNIHFTGYISSTSSTWFNIYCQPSTKGFLDINESLILTSAGASNTGKISANFRTYFKLWGGGAFTPALVGTSSAGAASGGAETGTYYISKGRCFFTLALTWTGHTGTGNFQINGLPVASRSGAQSVQPCAVVYSNLAVGSGQEVGAAVLANTQYVTLYAMDQAGGAVALIPVEAAGSLYITGSYEI